MEDKKGDKIFIINGWYEHILRKISTIKFRLIVFVFFWIEDQPSKTNSVFSDQHCPKWKCNFNSNKFYNIYDFN